jgi:HTH-type transcriptional regulator/antitoxin HigA
VRKRTAETSARRLPADFAGLVALHVPHVIRDEASYGNTMEVVDALTSIPKLSKGQMEYLDTLTVLVEAYERDRRAIDTSDLTGLDMLRHLVEANELTHVDLGRLLGVGPSAVSMILSGQRPVTAEHARKLGKRFGVNPGLFIV